MRKPAVALPCAGDVHGRRGEYARQLQNLDAYLKLMEKHQNTDPFKYIIYSGKISEQTPQLASGQ